MRIDDRVLRATRNKEGVRLVRQEGSEPLDSKVHQLVLDFLDGRVTTTSHEPLPEEIAPFFEEPIPAWLLDDLHAEWRKHRSLLDEPWYESALRDWQPGEMLSLLTAFPDVREDQYLRDGKRYLIDFSFCIAPGCTCAGNRFVVLQSTASDPREQVWTEIASAELDAELLPRDHKGTPEHRATLNALYLDWRARSGHPEAYLTELRENVLQRGRELLSRWTARQRSLPSTRSQPTTASPRTAASSPAATSSGKPGRNDPCPCGSGKKYKKCCAG